MVDEDLILDPRVAVLADVAGLGGEDDRRVAFPGEQDIRVAVDDQEPGQVANGALEAGVLAACDDERVQIVLRERVAHEAVAAVYLAHEASRPWISAVIAALSGVGTACSSPKRTMPPFR